MERTYLIFGSVELDKFVERLVDATYRLVNVEYDFGICDNVYEVEIVTL